MPLKRPHPPDAAADAFRNGLLSFLSVGPPNSEAFVGERPPIPSVADVETGGSHAVLQGFVLSLKDAATNSGVIRSALGSSCLAPTFTARFTASGKRSLKSRPVISSGSYLRTRSITPASNEGTTVRPTSFAKRTAPTTACSAPLAPGALISR